MLDPGLEHLHRHGRQWRESTERRHPLNERIADAMVIPPILLILFLAPATGWAPAWQVLLLVVAYAVTSVVRFEIGPGSTTPAQLLAVPIWFAVPPAFQPLVIGLALVLSGVIEHTIERRDESIWRVFTFVADAWPSVGPALVFAIAGSPEATLDAAPLVALAFMAQIAFDLFAGIATSWLNHGLRPAIQIRLMAWIEAVDAALAPIGFLVALVMATEPLAILAVFPLIAVIAEFARERKERIDQALQLSSAYRGTAQLMGDVLEADDSYTGGEHTQGVVEMAVAVALELKLDPRQMRDLEFGALLHDIGKLRVPNDIINKPGALDAAEWELIRRHPEYGQEMLDRVGGALTDAGEIVRAHHERWDGMGYPDRLRGDEIPIAARIITVCDSFSAMTTARSYSPAMRHEDGLQELERCSGTQFDPRVVEALFRVLSREPELRTGVQRVGQGSMSPVAASVGLRPIS